MRKVILAALVVAGITAPPASSHFTTGCRHDYCKRHVVRPFNAHLNRIAYCESRYRWHIDSTFDGGLQFSPSTWRATGSRYAYAWQAPVLEQKYRAVVWAHKIGLAWHSTAGWPVCG